MYWRSAEGYGRVRPDERLACREARSLGLPKWLKPVPKPRLAPGPKWMGGFAHFNGSYYSVKDWSVKVTPYPDMTPGQKKAALAQAYRRLCGKPEEVEE